MNEPKQPKKDSNAARRKSPIRQLQSLIDSGSLSPSEQLQAIKKLAALKREKQRARQAKTEKRGTQEAQPREWKPTRSYDGLYAAYKIDCRNLPFTGSYQEWQDVLVSCSYGHPNNGKRYQDILREVEAARKEQH